MTVPTRSKMWFCGRLLTGIAGSKLGVINIRPLLRFCVFCQVQVSATRRSLVYRSPTDCGVSVRFRQLDDEEAYAHEGFRATMKSMLSLPSLRNTQIFSGIDFFYFAFLLSLTNQTEIFLLFF